MLDSVVIAGGTPSEASADNGVADAGPDPAENHRQDLQAREIPAGPLNGALPANRRARTSRWLRAWGAATLCLALGGCNDPAPDNTLRMGLADPPRNLDPRFATDATSERINRLLYDRLVELDAARLPVPSLARWERPTPTSYVFVLEKAGQGADRRFSDGSLLDAEDVAATYRSVLDPATASPQRASLAMIRAVATQGQDRIAFELAEPDPLFPAFLGLGILPSEAITRGHPFHREPIGSGPFRFGGWPEPGRLRLVRRRDSRELEFLAVKDPNVRVMKLLRGEIDLLQNDLSPELLGYLAGSDQVGVQEVGGANFSYIGFNLDDPVTGLLPVRRAIAHAIDRAAILEFLFRDGARPAASLFPPGHWAGAPGLQPIPHDPARARALLAAAGFGPGRPLHLVFKTSSAPFRVRLATLIQAQLSQVGIAVDVRSYDWGTFYGDIKAGRFQLYGLSWVGIHTPDIFRYAFHSASVPPHGANRGRYRSARADRLIEEAEQATDLARKALLYRELQALLLEELPYVPLWYEHQACACRRRVHDYRLAPDGNYDALAEIDLAFDTADRLPQGPRRHEGAAAGQDARPASSPGQ